MAFKNTRNQTPDKPVKQFRCGALAVAIWQKEHEGKIYYSATPSRAYKEKDSDEWSYSDSLDYFDLTAMAQLLHMAFSWITNERAKAAAAERDNDEKD